MASDPEKTKAFATAATSVDYGMGQMSPVDGLSESEEEPKEDGLHRNFKARHVQMIGLAGCIGSGVFISTGEVSRTEEANTNDTDIVQRPSRLVVRQQCLLLILLSVPWHWPC